MFKTTVIDVSRFKFGRHIESVVLIEPVDEGSRFEFIQLPQMSDVVLLNFGNTIHYETVASEKRAADVITGEGIYIFGKTDQCRVIKARLEQPLYLIKFKPCALYIMTGEHADNYFNKVCQFAAGFDFSDEATSGRVVDFLKNQMKLKYINELEKVSLFEMLRHIDLNFVSVTVSELSERFNKSKVTLFRYFRKYIGVNLNTYIRFRKFKSMIITLYHDQYNAIASIEHGFFDQSHFIKAFKKSFYYTPLQFVDALEQRFSVNESSRQLFETIYIRN